MELTIKIDDKKKYQSLLSFLKSIGITIVSKKNGFKKVKKKYPLEGTVLKYKDPFGPATNTNDWIATK